ncbi:MAG: GTPase HflX [Candidatus Solibacter usitatus]|nr:GTPase HflX [Candidatus Solibacter usitatus]
MADSAPERAILIAVAITGRRQDPVAPDAEESLGELRALAESAGAVVADQTLQSRPAFDKATLIGSGKIEELKSVVKAMEIDVALVDHELGGTQQRNLEKALDCKVVDRTQLILDIFARRAHTREGQLQVELAQLNYLLPRLTGRGAAMSRLGGGIGTRGPGETKLETDRRRIHQRIKRIQDDLAAVRGSRGVQRRLRQAVPLVTLALVGYTNAGKSTLFNRLAGADVLADARMFATLDPTVRQLQLPSRRRVLLSDTVGFIRSLPTTLVQAFRATLEEVSEASLLLHVVDASSPSAAAHAAQVRQVCSEIGADATPQIIILNKADLLAGAPDDSGALARRLSGEAAGAPAVCVSARTGQGLDELLALIDRTLPADPVEAASFHIPHTDLATVNLLHEYARVTREQFTAEGCDIEAEVPASLLRRLFSYRRPA